MGRPMQALQMLLAVVVFLVPLFAMAEDPEKTQTAVRAKAPAPHSTSGAGLRAHIDPETGELIGYRAPGRADIQLSERVQEALSRSDEGLESITLPDGSVRVDLQGRFRHLNAARLVSGRDLESICVDHLLPLWEFIVASSSMNEAEGER